MKVSVSTSDFAYLRANLIALEGHSIRFVDKTVNKLKYLTRFTNQRSRWCSEFSESEKRRAYLIRSHNHFTSLISFWLRASLALLFCFACYVRYRHLDVKPEKKYITKHNSASIVSFCFLTIRSEPRSWEREREKIIHLKWKWNQTQSQRDLWVKAASCVFCGLQDEIFISFWGF